MANIVKTMVSAVTVTLAAETVVAVTPAYVYDQPNPYVGGEHTGAGGGVGISGVVNFTVVGTAATAVTLRIRYGSGTGGAVVGTYTASVAAGSTYIFAYDLSDATRWAAQSGGGIYTLTAQMTAATANSTVGIGSIALEGM